MGRTRCQPAEPRRAAEDGRHGPAGRTVCRGGGEPASTDPRTRTPGLGARSGRWSGAARPRRAAGPASSPCQAPAQPAEMPIRQVPNSAHVTVPRRRSRTAARPVPRSPPPRPVTLAGTGTEGRCPARHPLPAAGSSPHARSGPRPTTRSTRGRCTARTAGSHADCSLLSSSAPSKARAEHRPRRRTAADGSAVSAYEDSPPLPHRPPGRRREHCRGTADARLRATRCA